MVDESDDSLDALQRAGRRRKLLGIVLAVVVGVPLVLFALMFVGDVIYPGLGEHVRKVVDGEHDIFGNKRYSPPHEVSAAQLADEVDLERVHSDLLPLWLAAYSHDAAGHPSDRTTGRYDELVEALEPDPNLHEIVVELGELLHSERADEHTDRILYLTWAWGEYLRQKDQPYHLETNIVLREQGPMLYSKNYAIAEEVPMRLGDKRYSGLLAERIDRTNVVENYLCRNTEGDQRPLWVIDTSAAEAAEVVWPMLSGQNDASLSELDAAFAEFVRTEAAGYLSAEALELLEQTAPTRNRMLRTAEAINERDCNKFRISYTPLVAFDVGRLDRLWSKAARAKGSQCPQITADELHALIDTSEALEAKKKELIPALEELAAFASRPRLFHELRHHTDKKGSVLSEFVLPCPGCDVRLDAPSRGELSAYLAGVAYSGAPAMGMYRVCRVATTSHTFHKRAVSPLVSRLADGQDCLAGPVEALEEQAREADTELFERDAPVELAGSWPNRLPMGN